MKSSFDNLTCKLFKSTKGKAIAFGSITIDDSFVVRINVYHARAKDSYYIQWPTVKNTKGEFVDQAFPITAKAREEIIALVTDELKKLDL